MFEYHNNILCIKAAALYNKSMYDSIVELQKLIDKTLQAGDQDAFMYNMRQLKELKSDYKNSPLTYLTYSAYKKKCQRNQLNKVQTGGNGREALVAWESVPVALRQHIIEHIGYDPQAEQKNKTFEDYITHDKQAEAYFTSFEKSDGEKLTDEQIKRYVFKANVLGAIHKLVKEREAKRMAFGKKRSVLFKNIAKKAVPNAVGVGSFSGFPFLKPSVNKPAFFEVFGKEINTFNTNFSRHIVLYIPLQILYFTFYM